MSALREPKPVTLRCPGCHRINRIDLSRKDGAPRCGSCGHLLRLDQPILVNESDFDRTIRDASVPILVDFYADWCGPCTMMAPTLDQMARDHAGAALILKIDTEIDQRLASRFSIRGIPTLIAFRDGRESGRHVGLAQRQELERLLGSIP
ncbi:MAG: thioredoxin [Gemmatimonadota bacterium]